jgi:hypothetical protein
MMKRAMLLSALTMLLALLFSTTTMGTGNHRSAIDDNWRKVEAWQKSQAAKFKRIERDAARELKSLNGQTEPYASKNTTYPSHGR